MSLLKWSICLWAVVQVALSLNVPADVNRLREFALSGSDKSKDSASGGMADLSRVERLFLSLNRVASHPQATSGVQTPEAMTRDRYAKRNQKDTSGQDGGEYVMGFWVPKSKRQQTATQWSPLASDERHPSAEGFTSGLARPGSYRLDKRFTPYRYIRRRVCDFTRLTANHILEYLKTGRICGRRVSNVRFALTGRK